MTNTPLLHDRVDELYKLGRFMDAWELTRDAWFGLERMTSLSRDELLMAGRLARRLGGEGRTRGLFRQLRRNGQVDAQVRYYMQGLDRPLRSHLDRLRGFDSLRPDPDDDPAFRAVRFGSHAINLSLVRDFDAAEVALGTAREAGVERAWVDTCAAAVALQRADWDEAAALATGCWERAPGLPYTAFVLGESLAAVGRAGEAAVMMLGHAREAPQSYEVLLTGLWHALAALERGDRSPLAVLPEGIHAATGGLAALAPLANRALLRKLAHLRANAACHEGRREDLRRHAEVARTPFYLQVAKNLAACPEGRRRVLPHDATRQKHMTCLPASLVCCASAHGERLDHDALVWEMTHDGTPHWRVMQWAEREGWAIRPFVGVPDSCAALIEAGFPFIYTQRGLGGAHAVAAVGLDRGMGTLILHDPSRHALGEILLEGSAQGQWPVGPDCLAIAPPGRAAELAAVALEGETYTSGLTRLEQALTTGSQAEAAAIVASVTAELEESGDDVQADYLRAIERHHRGDAAGALELSRSLLSQHPESVQLQSMTLRAAQGARDTAGYREVLKAIVDKAPLPGVDGSAAWIHPEPIVMGWYADLLSQSATHFGRARSLLDKALRRQPTEGRLYHYLGDLLARQDRWQEAELAQRIASCLDLNDPHFAEAYAWTLKRAGRVEEAVGWLRSRVDKLAKTAGAGAAHVTLIQGLEAFGRPDESLAAMREAMRVVPEDGTLARFGVEFLARHGELREAREVLQRCQRLCAPGEYEEAAHDLAVQEGDLTAALEHGRRWLQERPRSTVAMHCVLGLVQREGSVLEARALLGTWRRESPDSDALEELELQWLSAQGEEAARVPLLQARVARNPLDAWAWRELAWAELRKTHLLAEADLAAGVRRFRELVSTCVRSDPAASSTAALQAELSVLDGDVDGAIGHLERALKAAPDYGWAMRRLFELTEELKPARRQRVLPLLDRVFASSSRDLTLANIAARYVAGCFDVDTALAAVERWGQMSPDDPVVTEAWADVLLTHGQGRVSNEQVVARLERMTAMYPLHGGLAFSLAIAHGALGRLAEAQRGYERVLELRPGWVRARMSLAETLELAGRPDEALGHLRRAVRDDPSDFGAWMKLAGLLLDRGDVDGALEVLTEANHSQPAFVELWERRIELLGDTGRPQEALEVAEALRDRFPDGAYANLILARTRRRSPLPIPRADVEAVYRDAIGLNARLWDGVWEYVGYLCEQFDFGAAREAVQAWQALEGDKVCAKGAMATITWAAGERREAVQEMRAVLAEHPDYRFGTLTLWGWLEELGDKATLLETLRPPQMRNFDDVEMACGRLNLLQRAGEASETLDAEWRALAHAWPASARVRLEYFDFLTGCGRFDEAGPLLDDLPESLHDQPPALARRVLLACHREDVGAATGLLRELYTLQGNEIPWCSWLAMDAMERAGYVMQALDLAATLLAQGERVVDSCVEMLLRLLQQRGDGALFERLIAVLERSRQPAAAASLRQVLAAYVEAGGAAFVREWGQAHRASCQQSTPLWQIVGRAHTIDDLNREAIAWYGDWRDHPGAEHWSLGNLAAALHDTGQWHEAIDVCRHALAHCATDHTSAYLVETCLRCALYCDREATFREVYDRHHAILELHDEPSKQASFQSLAYFARLLDTEEIEDLRKLHRASKSARKGSGWANDVWGRMLGAKLPWPQRVLLWFGLW